MEKRPTIPDRNSINTFLASVFTVVALEWPHTHEHIYFFSSTTQLRTLACFVGKQMTIFCANLGMILLKQEQADLKYINLLKRRGDGEEKRFRKKERKKRKRKKVIEIARGEWRMWERDGYREY